MGNSILGLTAIILATSFAAAGLGILIAVFSKTVSQANALSTIVILLFSAIGGSWFPRFLMPAWMQKLSWFTVNSWGIEGFYNIMIRKKGISGIIEEVSVLIAFAVFFFIAATVKFIKDAKKANF